MQITTPNNVDIDIFSLKNIIPIGINIRATIIFISSPTTLILQPDLYAIKKPSSNPTTAIPKTMLAQFTCLMEPTKLIIFDQGTKIKYNVVDTIDATT